MYQQYSTTLKICYALGVEKHFINKEIRELVPFSTAHHWKNTIKNTDTIIGFEVENQLQKHKKDICVMLHPVNKTSLQCFTAFCHFTVMLVGLFDKKVFGKILRTNKAKIINCLEMCSDFISYQEAAEWFSISLKTLYNWKHQVKFSCDASALLLCIKRHLNQATFREVSTIKQYLNNPQYLHWGIASIWGKAFKNGDTSLAKQSWYRYNKLMRIRNKAIKEKKPVYYPIRALKVNDIFHADITLFKTQDGIRWYIYTVMDNFSRYIYSWQIERVVSANIRLETIKEAIKNAFGNHDFDDVQLITDGGPENNNLTIKEYIRKSNITHHSALRDIPQSNSMQEAFYSIAKYRYLYRKPIENGEHLKKVFAEMIHEYHTERPHYALGIYTPEEVKNGADIFASHRKIHQQAAIIRSEENKKAQCSQKCH